jgi:hypothetical protein
MDVCPLMLRAASVDAEVDSVFVTEVVSRPAIIYEMLCRPKLPEPRKFSFQSAVVRLAVKLELRLV